jgi:EpsI family protein
VLLVAAAVGAVAMKPIASSQAIDLERALPERFGDWRVDSEIAPIAPTADAQANVARIYDQIVSRTYVNSAGERIMLMVAYGGDQSDALKAHRQEKCYEAQGFDIVALERGAVAGAGRTLPVTRMVAVRGERIEPVTYWFTMGERVVHGRAERLGVQLSSGLAGRIPDGMLVRVSSISGDPGGAFAAQRAFIASIFASVAPQDAPRFLGAGKA